MFVFGGKSHRAHRVAYEIAHGVPPGDLLVRHNCDNPRCVCPEHLSLGTSKENMEDKVSRKRAPNGEQVTTSVLDWPQVRDIRKRYADGGITKAALAREYGVTPPAIRYVISGKTWKEENDANR